MLVTNPTTCKNPTTQESGGPDGGASGVLLTKQQLLEDRLDSLEEVLQEQLQDFKKILKEHSGQLKAQREVLVRIARGDPVKGEPSDLVCGPDKHVYLQNGSRYDEVSGKGGMWLCSTSWT